MALPQAKIDVTEARIAQLPSRSVGWSAAAREDAVTRLRAQGLPLPRDEYWRFTKPAAFVAQEVTSIAEVHSTNPFEAHKTHKLVFVDGVLDEARSSSDMLESVQIDMLSAVQEADIHWAKSIFGVLEAQGQTPVDRPMAALNTAYASEGVLISVSAKIETPIEIVYETTGAADPILHHVIRVEADAALTLLESGTAGARSNIVTEIQVADGGAFHHVRLNGPDHDRVTNGHMFAHLGSDSLFKSFTLSANDQMTRNETVIYLDGDDSAAHVAGAAFGDGSDFHHDDTIFITHDALNCESRQVFKKVLRNGATGVFQGKILVKEGAQKTDGYQISQSLLLDDDSQFLAKPELEIYADDVACSHGSTTGAIDEDALFYLKSRGVPKREATDMLTLAFLAEAVEEIADDTLRETVTDRLVAWLTAR